VRLDRVVIDALGAHVNARNAARMYVGDAPFFTDAAAALAEATGATHVDTPYGTDVSSFLAALTLAMPAVAHARSGQVRCITRPKSEAMRVTRQLGLPPRNRRVCI
jgi:hypothetical protein